MRKWGLRQEFISSTMSVVNIIKYSTKCELKLLAEQNTWRRDISNQLLVNLGKDIKKLAKSTSSHIPDSLQSMGRAPDASTGGS